jgi:hypothetical protein
VTATDDWFSATLDATSTLLGGRYAVLGVLGAGAMGSVFKVRDLELDEDVPLRVQQGGGLPREHEERLVCRARDRGDLGQHRGARLPVSI